MSLTPVVLPDADAVGASVAGVVLRRLDEAGDRPFLLGCPSGRSALPVYQSLARAARTGADLSSVVVVLMDDYLTGADDHPVRVDVDRSFSCVGFAQREILAPIERACASAGTTAPTEIWAPDPADPAAYDDRIAAAGGIDLFLLASGASDGHIAFNQPGTPRAAGTHVVRLGEATRRDNMGTFPEFTELSMVPARGVTVGIDTIASLSREVAMLVCGEHKRDAFRRLVAADGYEPDWPATIVAECRDATIYADRAAASSWPSASLPS